MHRQYGTGHPEEKVLESEDISVPKATPSPQIVSCKMDLNFDILVLMMYFLPKKDVLSCMLTCRALYDSGLPFLGRDINFNDFISYSDTKPLTFQQQFQSFLSFIRVDPPWLAEGLLEIVEHGRLIQSLDLRLGRGGPSVFETHPRLSAAISSLTNLKYISLTVTGSRGYRMLKEMRSPLVAVNVNFMSYEDRWGTRTEPYVDPLPLLSHLSSSLKVLGISGVDIKSEHHIFPDMKELTIVDNAFDTIAPLIRAFPNIRRCQLTGTALDNPDAVEQLRAANLITQARVRWDKLEYLSGCPETIHSYAPCTQVLHLKISPLYAPESHRFLSPILLHTQPLCLEIFAVIRNVRELKEMVENLNLAVFATRTRFFKLVSRTGWIAACNRKKENHADLGFAIASQLILSCSSLRHIYIDLAGQLPGFWRVEPANVDAGVLPTLIEVPYGRASSIMRKQGFSPRLKTRKTLLVSHLEVFGV
ncbi:hypothetical protein PHLCEN_2v8417 [Hermanssonia centrifuga]|uniref:F-box domain-containing protein n=1 Tax=Hermanssonia centrifuga TaxID=98765 RepID=A0A2R6NTR5_9APHY|nr:hypothetical protein PHLCEN_2v8417 [Hermanssonia centrifuga]